MGRYALALGMMLLLGVPNAMAQSLPPIPQDLLTETALVCLKVGIDGKVADIFLISSTGDAGRDGEVLAWAKQLHWDKTAPTDQPRNTWMPVALAFGGAQPPDAPSSCAPPHLKGK